MTNDSLLFSTGLILGFLIGAIVGCMLLSLHYIDTYEFTSKKYIVQQDYGYYDSDKELVIRDEFKKYYEEVK